MISVQLAQGHVDDAEAQLEVFRMIAESIGRSATAALLDAQVRSKMDGRRSVSAPSHASLPLLQLAWRKSRDRASQLRYLREAETLHLAALDLPATPRGAGGVRLPPPYADPFEWYALVEPELFIDIAREMLQQVRGGRRERIRRRRD